MRAPCLMWALSLVYPLHVYAQTSSAVHIVQVSNARGDLAFTPSNVVAAVGDMVQFQFSGANHSVVSSAFSAPCVPQTDLSGDFNSGFMPVATSSTAETLPVFTIKIQNTLPIYYYCAQAKHCQYGMVGGINTPSSSPGTIADYKLAAAALASASSSSSVTSQTPTSSPTTSPASATSPTTGQSATSSSTSTATSRPTSQPTSQPASQSNVASGTGISSGLIAGIVLGSAAILLAATGLWLWWRRMPRKEAKEDFVILKAEMDAESRWSRTRRGPHELEVSERPVEVAGSHRERHSIYELGLGR